MKHYYRKSSGYAGLVHCRGSRACDAIGVSNVISKGRLVLDRRFIYWYLNSRGYTDRGIAFERAQQASHKDGIPFFSVNLDHSTIVPEPSSTGITVTSHQRRQGVQHAFFFLRQVFVYHW